MSDHYVLVVERVSAGTYNSHPEDAGSDSEESELAS